jgi:hypothetical protein
METKAQEVVVAPGIPEDLPPQEEHTCSCRLRLGSLSRGWEMSQAILWGDIIKYIN